MRAPFGIHDAIVAKSARPAAAAAEGTYGAAPIELLPEIVPEIGSETTFRDGDAAALFARRKSSLTLLSAAPARSALIRSKYAPTTPIYCGLSSRNASCPCAATISAYETARRLSTSALTISRERAGAKRQSVVNETTRKAQRARASARPRSP